MGLQNFDERDPLQFSKVVLAADGITRHPLMLPGVGNARVDSIVATNSDAIAHVVILSLLISAVETNLGSASIPAGQGYAGTPGLDLLALILPATQVGLVVGALETLRYALEVVMGGTTHVDLTVNGGFV